MFGIEFFYGHRFHSMSLLGDSLDMLGDAIAYASSLYVVGLGLAAKAHSARIKGWIMMATGLMVLLRAIYQFAVFKVPDPQVMGWIGGLALVANLICLLLLSTHRRADINMRSIWICSRNDIIANLAILAAASVVAVLHSPWPDLIVGLTLDCLFIQSSTSVLKEAKVAMA